MRRSIILNTEQVKKLQSGETLIISMPVAKWACAFFIPRNIFDKVREVVPNDDDERTEDSNGFSCNIMPYSIGQSIYVREKWMPSPNGDKIFCGQIIGNGFEYFATASDQYKEEWKSWRPSANMPKEAARLFPVVQSVDCTQDNGTWVFLIELKIDIQKLTNK